MDYGYVREGVSTPDVDSRDLYNAECSRLYELGVKRLITDNFHITGKERRNLNALMEEIKPGDRLFIARLGSMAASISKLVEVLDYILKKGVDIHIDGIGWITGSPDDRLYQLLLRISEAEHDMGIDKSLEWRELNKENIIKIGRPRISKEIMDQAMAMLEREKNVEHVAKELGISRSSLFREIARRQKNQSKTNSGKIK